MDLQDRLALALAPYFSGADRAYREHYEAAGVVIAAIESFIADAAKAGPDKSGVADDRLVYLCDALAVGDGSERVGLILQQLYGLYLFDALSILVTAMTEVVSQAADQPAVWDAVLQSIAVNRQRQAQQ